VSLFHSDQCLGALSLERSLKRSKLSSRFHYPISLDQTRSVRSMLQFVSNRLYAYITPHQSQTPRVYFPSKHRRRLLSSQRLRSHCSTMGRKCKRAPTFTIPILCSLCYSLRVTAGLHPVRMPKIPWSSKSKRNEKVCSKEQFNQGGGIHGGIYLRK